MIGADQDCSTTGNISRFPPSLNCVLIGINSYAIRGSRAVTPFHPHLCLHHGLQPGRRRLAHRDMGALMANELVGKCFLIDFPSAPLRWTMTKLCDCADANGTNVFPSVATICDETSLSLSAVRASLAAFEQCQLLSVKENKFGNAAGKTTVVREIDIDLLALIAGERKKGKPKEKSSHVMALVDLVVMPGQRVVQHPDAVVASLVEPPRDSKGRLIEDDVPRKLKVWAIIPRQAAPAKPKRARKKKADSRSVPDEDGIEQFCAPPGDGGVDPAETPPGDGGVATEAPLQEVEEYPSRRWRSPLQEVEATPPGGGANPLIDPFTDPSPHTPHGGSRRRRGRVREIDDLILKIRTPERARAIALLIEPVVRKLRIDAPDPAFALGQFADLVAKETDGVLEEASKRLFEERVSTAKVADIEAAVFAARKAADDAAKIAASPWLFEGTDAWRRALASLAEVNPMEAQFLSNQGKVRRDHLAKFGVTP
jgi:hypothetical protein